MAHIQSPISEKNKADLKRIAEISGENLLRCMQCGTCSAVCPMVESMELTTRQGMHLLQFGLTEDVMKAKIGDFCASCHECSVRCPRDIDVAKVYEAVRQLTLRRNENMTVVNGISKETMAQAPQIAFVSSFRKLTS
jgi:heterodisulfide reductase subunit C2